MMKMLLPYLATIEQSSRYVAAWCAVSQQLYPHPPETLSTTQRGAPYSYEEALLMFDIARRRSWHVQVIISALANRPQTWTWDIKMNALLQWWEQFLDLERKYLGIAEDFYAMKKRGQSQRIRNRRRRLDGDETVVEILDRLVAGEDD